MDWYDLRHCDGTSSGRVLTATFFIPDTLTDYALEQRTDNGEVFHKLIRNVVALLQVEDRK
jgi:hypothetical protein